MKRFPVVLCLAGILAAGSLNRERTVMSHITSDALRGHVAFLSSDLLEGRDTPSRGLDIAAEYIATQFRSIGLEAPGADGYFQNANVILRDPNNDGLDFTISGSGRSVRIGSGETYLVPGRDLDIDNESLVVLNEKTQMAAQAIAGAVVFLESTRIFEQVEGKHPALILYSARRLPTRPRLTLAGREGALTVPVVSAELASFLRDAKDPRITLHAKAAREQTFAVRNVVGLLRGADPKLRDQYVIVSSHYDHIGLAASGADRIYNGANDDASGVASVIETARALASLHPRPKRSVLFVLFFGEEKGLLGSRYYAAHPLEPLAETVAQLNLEQMGRTDSSEGPKIRSANLTGWDFSTVTRTVAEAGQQAGITITKDPKASDAYFDRSDNASLARAGIPAHTMSVTYEFPDYHAVGDEWQKIDYDNMAQVDRAVALAVLKLASSPVAPAWNPNYAPARSYAEAAKRLSANPPAPSQFRR